MLRLSFFPSRYLAALLTLAHCLGLAAVWTVDWPPWIKIPVSLAVLASWMFYLRRDGLLQMPHSAIAILLKGDGSIEVSTRDGTTIVGEQVPGSFVHPWFTTVLWRAEGARFSRSVIVLPDSLPPDQFRELRVWLKWRRWKPDRI